MALDFGNKVENGGIPPNGVLSATEFNQLVAQVNQNEEDIVEIGTPNSIEDIEVTESQVSGGNNVITITETNGTETTFNVKNGEDGANGVSLGDVEIADNLTTNDATKVLSAKQGKVLKDALDSQTFPIVNNLTEGGEGSALSAEMGKVLAARLAEADAKWTDIDHGEAMSVDCVKQIRFLTLTVIGDVYDSMSLDGVKNVMALTATYDDRSTEPITEFTVTGVVKAGNQNFIATYNGIKASLAVEVLHRTATLASVSANSSVNEVSMWTETEELRKYITVTKVYSDSTTELTKDYTLSGELQQGASTITVSYYGDTTKTTTLTFTGVNDGSYVTDSLEAMVDFSDYADGYTGEIIDKAKGHQVVLNASLANAATKAPYGGIHGGKLVQAQWYEGTSDKGLTMDLKGCAPAGVVTVELYARIRGKYSGSGATPTIGAISTSIMAMSSFAISPNSPYANFCRYAPQGEINLNGPAAEPDITTSDLNLPYYDSSHTDVKELVHIVYTMANKLQKLYVNGQLIIDDSRGGYSCTGGTDVRIFPNLGYVAADIAVVRVYGKALNNKEVQRNYINCQANHGTQIN